MHIKKELVCTHNASAPPPLSQTSGGPMFSQLSQWQGGPKAIKLAQPVVKPRGAEGQGDADFGVTHMFNLLMEHNVVH